MGIINTIEIIYVAFMKFLPPIHCWSTTELIKIYKHLGRSWKCNCHSVLQDVHHRGQLWPEIGRVDVPGMTRKGWRPWGDTTRTQKYRAQCKRPAGKFSAAGKALWKEKLGISPHVPGLLQNLAFLRCFPLAPSCLCLRWHPFAPQDFACSLCPTVKVKKKGGRSVLFSIMKVGIPSLSVPIPACFTRSLIVCQEEGAP